MVAFQTCGRLVSVLNLIRHNLLLLCYLRFTSLISRGQIYFSLNICCGWIDHSSLCVNFHRLVTDLQWTLYYSQQRTGIWYCVYDQSLWWYAGVHYWVPLRMKLVVYSLSLCAIGYVITDHSVSWGLCDLCSIYYSSRDLTWLCYYSELVVVPILTVRVVVYVLDLYMIRVLNFTYSEGSRRTRLKMVGIKKVICVVFFWALRGVLIFLVHPPPLP